MDLEAALDASHATGPRFLDGLGYLLRSDRKRSRLTFLQPYDPEKIPIVLIHGLISTPRMWAPVVKGLMAVPEIRERYQFWFSFTILPASPFLSRRFNFATRSMRLF
jgi:hypothetical protein